MAWSPDGARIAAGGGFDFVHEGDERVTQVEPERSLLLVDAEGRSPQSLGAQPGGVWGLAWSHDGTRIAVLGETLRILDARQGDTLLELEIQGSHLAWSPDDRHIALIEHSDDHEVNALRLRDALSGDLVASIEGDADTHFGRPLWAPDGERLAYTTFTSVERANDADHITGSALHLRDAFGDEPPQTLHRSSAWLYHFDWSPDGRFIVFPLQGGIHVVDAGDGRRVASLAPNSIPNYDKWPEGRFMLHAATWSPDGRRVAASGFDPSGSMGSIRSAALVWELTFIAEGQTRAFIHSSQVSVG